MLRSRLSVEGSGVYIETYGTKELIEFLETLPEDIRPQVEGKIIKENMKPLVKSARAKVRSVSNSVAKTIGTWKSKSYNGVWITGPRKDRKMYRDQNWFAHFIEYGTSGIKQKKTKRSGRFRRGISSEYAGYVASKKKDERYRPDQPARPFMRPAWAETQAQITRDILKDAEKAVYRDFKRYRRRTAKLRAQLR